MSIPLIHGARDYPVIASRCQKVVNHSTTGRANKKQQAGGERRLLLRRDTSIRPRYITVHSPICLKVNRLECNKIVGFCGGLHTINSVRPVRARIQGTSHV